MLKPPREEIHLWRLLLDELPGDCSSLAADEQLRADKLVATQHRHRFIAMRSALRSLLGTYLQLSPGSVVFVYGEKGKPSLAADLNRLDLRFNVSHSGGIGLIAVASGCRNRRGCRDPRGRIRFHGHCPKVSFRAGAQSLG